MSLRSGIELLQGKLLTKKKQKNLCLFAHNITLDDLNQIFDENLKSERNLVGSGQAIAIKRSLQRVPGKNILIYVATVGAILTLSYRLI